MKLNELIKERMVIRQTNPLRSTVLGLLVDNAKKIAKNENREATDSDIELAAKRMKTEALSAIEMYVKAARDITDLQNEVKILDEFLPKSLPQDEMEAVIRSIVETLPVESRVMKNIMPQLKQVPGVDMKFANSYLQGLLK